MALALAAKRAHASHQVVLECNRRRHEERRLPNIRRFSFIFQSNNRHAAGENDETEREGEKH
jgi:hypothetical protein